MKNPKVSSMFRTALLLAATLLAACSAFKDKEEPRLQGTRISVTQRGDVLKPTPGADAEPFILPAPAATPNWPTVGGNAAHAPGQVALPANVMRAWSRSIGTADSALINPPIVHSGRVFAMTDNDEVTAYSLFKGKELWQVRLPLDEKNITSSGGLAVEGDLLFVTTGSGQVFALTASSGKKVWEVSLGVPLRAAPTADGQRVFVVSHDNRTFALNALDGALLWTHSGVEEALAFQQAAPIASANGIVVVPYNSGEVYALRGTDGRYIWHDTLTTPFTGQDPDSTVTSIAAPPVVADGLVYVVGLNGGLSAYGLANGQRFWRVNLTSGQMPLVAGFQIFALTDDGRLVCLNRKDGTIRWVAALNDMLPKFDDKGQRLFTGPILAGGRLIVATSDGFALSLAPETGAKVASTSLGEGINVPPVVADNTLLFLTQQGELIAFRPKQ